MCGQCCEWAYHVPLEALEEVFICWGLTPFKERTHRGHRRDFIWAGFHWLLSELLLVLLDLARSRLQWR